MLPVELGKSTTGFNAVPLNALLLAGTATVVAWDAGEHAINVGEHLGRGGDTRETELAHIVGLLGVEVARFSGGVGPSGLSLGSLVLLLVAVVLFAVALHD